jgi:protein TonB
MYQSRSGGARQVLGTGVLVGAIQVGVGLALLTTFAGGEIRAVLHKTLNARQWTYLPPPVPRPSPTAHSSAPNHDPITTPQPAEQGLVPPTLLFLGPVAPLPSLAGDGRDLLTDFPGPKPTPPLPSIAAHPLGDTGSWITPGDYPSRALRESWSGVTRLHLVIGSDGRVTACSVIASSGHDMLDAVACDKVSQRARFSPARDGTGATREGAFDSAIRWQIQEE